MHAVNFTVRQSGGQLFFSFHQESPQVSYLQRFSLECVISSEKDLPISCLRGREDRKVVVSLVANIVELSIERELEVSLICRLPLNSLHTYPPLLQSLRFTSHRLYLPYVSELGNWLLLVSKYS